MTIFHPRSRTGARPREEQFLRSRYVPAMKSPSAEHRPAATRPCWITLRSTRRRNQATKTSDLAEVKTSNALPLRVTLGVPAVRIKKVEGYGMKIVDAKVI